MSKNSGRYSDIIDLPHHQSIYRSHMTVYNRAAQFAPFAALVGYDEMVQDMEGMLLNDKRILLDEDRKYILDERLKILREHLKEQPEFVIIFFDENIGGEGGGYLTISGKLKKIEEYPTELILCDGTRVSVDNVIEIYVPFGIRSE